MNTKDIDDFLMQDDTPEPPQEEGLPSPIIETRKEYRESNKQNSVMSRGIPELTLDAGLPANVDAEKTILGAVLLDNEALKSLSLTIKPDDFWLDSHRRIFLCMTELIDSGRVVDIVTLSNELSRHKEVEKIGGIAYLASLTEGLPRRPVIDEYLRIVRDKSIARSIIGVASAAITRAADQSLTALESLQILDSQLALIKENSKDLLRNNSRGPFLAGFSNFIQSAPEVIDWTVDGIIQREGNGLILGDSGTSKSLLVFDLALHLVAGVAWFYHAIKKRVKVGLVAREDAPGLSQSRLHRLRDGASGAVDVFLDTIDLNEWLYVNTRFQRETWSLQKEMDIQEIIEATKERGIKFLFFDVFRTLWEGNENDNQETAKVLDSANRIGRETGAQICIVHHLSKSDHGTIFDRARGGGINGWKQWGIALSIENPEANPRDQIRKMQFHTKASCAVEPIFYRIDGYEKKLCLEEVEAPTQQYSYRNEKKEKKPSPPQSSIPHRDDQSEVPF